VKLPAMAEHELMPLQHALWCDVCRTWTPHGLVIGGSHSGRYCHACIICGETTNTVFGDEPEPLPSDDWPSVNALDYAGRAPVCVLGLLGAILHDD